MIVLGIASSAQISAMREIEQTKEDVAETLSALSTEYNGYRVAYNVMSSLQNDQGLFPEAYETTLEKLKGFFCVARRVLDNSEHWEKGTYSIHQKSALQSLYSLFLGDLYNMASDGKYGKKANQTKTSALLLEEWGYPVPQVALPADALEHQIILPKVTIDALYRHDTQHIQPLKESGGTSVEVMD